VILDGNDWSYNCFNCNYKARFKNGQQLSLKARNLLKWLGVTEDEIKKINFDSLKNKKIYDIAQDRTDANAEIIQNNTFFAKVELPISSRTILREDTWAIDYLRDERGLTPADYQFRISPTDTGRNATRIIIPYTHHGDVVGWTSRYLDGRFPKYINEHQQPGYLFGIDLQKSDWDYIIVAEGAFCAISINGVAVLHNEMNEQQIATLRRQGKEVIVVPDQDKAGLVLAEQALDAGFSISIPNWPMECNDINNAVLEYGKLGTLLSIIATKTPSKVRARVMINNLVARKKIK
jgi:hypothetical protein